MSSSPPKLPYVVFLFAGNADQAATYAQTWLHPRQPWSYIEDREHLRGLRGLHVVRVGSWARRFDVAEIEQALAERCAQFVTPEVES